MDKKDAQLNLLFLEYQRYVSRAHTIFSSFFEISLGILFGVFTVVLGLVEIDFIPWNKFYFLLMLLSTCTLIAIVLMIATFRWYDSRIQRKKITLKIKILGNITE